MDTQRDKLKFDAVEKVKGFLAYASEIGRGEARVRQETTKRQRERVKEASRLALCASACRSVAFKKARMRKSITIAIIMESQDELIAHYSA